MLPFEPLASWHFGSGLDAFGNHLRAVNDGTSSAASAAPPTAVSSAKNGAAKEKYG